MTWETHNPGGRRRVIVTKELPGERWMDLLIAAGCRVEVAGGTRRIEPDEIADAVGAECHGAIGQLNERWDAGLLETLCKAGGVVFSTFAVGYDNVDVPAATALRLPVGNTPGVLTEATAELAVALTFAAARRIVEGGRMMLEGSFDGWLPSLLLGKLLWRRTVGVVGAGRIGSMYARMMVEGHKMDLVYYNTSANERLEDFVQDYGEFLVEHAEPPVHVRRAESLEDLLRSADVVSVHAALTDSTRHLIDARRLRQMKENAILVNAGRGALVDEEALVAHCRAHPRFFAALDVYEREPRLTPGLVELPNVVCVPHIGSATGWTRRGMATLAAANVAAMLRGWPVWKGSDMLPFLEPEPPRAAPSIVNARELGLPRIA